MTGNGTRPLGVIISHGHQDHWGLAPQLPTGIPVFIGEGAANILRAARFWGNGVDLREAGHLRDRVPFTLGPFTITAYLADHSAYDAFSLLIEAGGRTGSSPSTRPRCASTATWSSTSTPRIAAATGRPSIPAVGDAWPRVGFTSAPRWGQRVRVKESSEFERVARIRERRLYAEQLRERAGGLVLFGACQGEIPSLLRDGILTGGAVVWSLWDG